MLAIPALLRVHDRWRDTAHALPDNLGDGYLLRHNRLFRVIRRTAIAHGYAFTSEPFASYEAFPLSALTAIHRARLIPYVDNVSILRSLAGARRAVRLLLEAEVALGGEQALDERVGRREQHAVAALDQLVADRAHQVHLAAPGQAEREQVVAALDERALAQRR